MLIPFPAMSLQQEQRDDLRYDWVWPALWASSAPHSHTPHLACVPSGNVQVLPCLASVGCSVQKSPVHVATRLQGHVPPNSGDRFITMAVICVYSWITTSYESQLCCWPPDLTSHVYLISTRRACGQGQGWLIQAQLGHCLLGLSSPGPDRKSTRLNSSHL